MKKLKVSMMSLAMILFVAATVYPMSSNEPLPTTPPTITYVVNVQMSQKISLCNTYHVTLRDQNGVLVTEPQLYQEGVSYYSFHENGPVSGTRIANLEENIPSDNPSCTLSIYTEPDVMKTRFRNNKIYFFVLYPLTGSNNH